MSKPGLAVTRLASATCFLVAGCYAAPCPPAKCPTARFDLRALDDSSVTWTDRGSPPQTTTGFVPYPPSGTDCAFEFYEGSIVGPVGDSGVETLLQGFFDLNCNGGDMGAFDFVVSKLGDFREWQAGSFTMIAPRGSFGVDYFGSAGTGCNVANLNGIAMMVTVETATGGRAPHPKLVTDDFVRTFRLDFDTSTVTPTLNGGGACDFPVVGQVSLHLTQTAADYVYDPNAPCICE